MAIYLLRSGKLDDESAAIFRLGKTAYLRTKIIRRDIHRQPVKAEFDAEPFRDPFFLLQEIDGCRIVAVAPKEDGMIITAPLC